LIGRCLAASNAPGPAPFEIIPLTRPALDLTDFAAVEKRFAAERPALVIHCAALSKSPDCQARPDLAQKINVDVTAHLAALAADAGFIFFSTDLVFDGREGNYVETDAVNPLSIYGATKVQAEQIVLRNPRHTVIRTSLNSGASPGGLSAYNEQLQAAWRKGQTVNPFFDEFRSPIPASVTARAVWELAARRHPELAARIKPESLREYRGPARPPDTSLHCAKVQKLLSFPLPGLTSYLRDHPEEPF